MRLLTILGVLLAFGKERLGRRRRGCGSGGRPVLLVDEAADEDDGRRRKGQYANEREGTHREAEGRANGGSKRGNEMKMKIRALKKK